MRVAGATAMQRLGSKGTHLRLRKVRFVTYMPGDPIPEPALVEFAREAGQLATMSREERLAREPDGD